MEAEQSTFRRILVLWLKITGVVTGILAIVAIVFAPMVLTMVYGPDWSVFLGFAGTLALCILGAAIVSVLDENPDFMA